MKGRARRGLDGRTWRPLMELALIACFCPGLLASRSSCLYTPSHRLRDQETSRVAALPRALASTNAELAVPIRRQIPQRAEDS